MAEPKIYNGYEYTQQPDGSWRKGRAVSQPQGVTISQGNPYAAPKAQADLTNTQTNIADTGIDNAREDRNNRFSHVTKLANDYNADPSVKSYRVAVQQFAQALQTGEGPQGDMALTIAFAKAMDPESVVRGEEQDTVANSQPWLDAAVEKTKKQFGMDGAGLFTPEAREELRRQISSSVAQRAKVYDARRHYYEGQARALGLEPELILGEHDAKPFVPLVQDWVKRVNGEQQPENGLTNTESNAAPKGQELLGYSQDGAPIYGFRTKDGRNPLDGDPNYIQSPLQQGVYGVNDGIASTLGLPVDVMTAGMNLVPKGINAIANTDIPEIQNPVAGGEWMKEKFRDIGFVGPDAETTGGQFARRVGNSVGAALVPLPGASLREMAAPLVSALTGGVAAATAQQVAPGNKVAELGAEVAGSFLGARGSLGVMRGRAQREIEGAIPTTDELRKQASGLYRQAETRGVTASPQQTAQLADDMRATLRREGQLGPNGRISDADTSTNRALNLVEQYAGQPMRPTEMDTVRRVIADGRSSTDPADRRLAGILQDQFDAWVRPLAPEFDEARGVASRYLQAGELERARELAGARAGQFTGSGFENALRTEYRALDRNNVKERNWFDEPVVSAIQDVSRGTTGSNFARNVGRFAPTGPVSGAATVGVPFAIGSAIGGPGLGTVMSGTAAGAGLLGREAATRMGIRNADIAELTARNGGAINQAVLLPGELQSALALAASGQLGNYVGEPQAEQDQAPYGEPDSLAGAIGRPPPRPRGLFGRPGY